MLQIMPFNNFLLYRLTLWHYLFHTAEQVHLTISQTLIYSLLLHLHY